ncbi:paralemmin-3 [Trichomycterus rosablanca]|uniref:paralemmin-3 n=1 Tax=Trichomycterus rosablanca TaxID=2290929 RepID=UPI002F34F2F5
MDEAEKYQKRLQAIAEKRRLLEEEERAKRQQEDEKLRLQQLRRKSLRDQWLMEATPPSPNSSGPQSPPWSPRVQQIEEHVDKLQSDTLEQKHVRMDEASESTPSHTHHHGNGEKVLKERTETPPPTGSLLNSDDLNSDEEHDDSSPASSLTNCTNAEEKSHDANLHHVTDVSNGVETLLFLGYTEAEPGQGLCEEEHESAAVIRAERVIITDEGEEVELHQEETQAEEDQVEDQVEDSEKREETQAEEDEVEDQVKDEVEDEEDSEKQEEKEEEEEAEALNNLEDSSKEGEAPERGEDPTDPSREIDVFVKINTIVTETTNADVTVDTHAEHASTVVINTPKIINVDPKEKTIKAEDKPSVPDPSGSTEVERAISGLLDTLTPPQYHSQTPEGATRAPETQSTSASKNNGTQKSPGPSSPSAQFQEIPLDGTPVEEEPLLATRVEPLMDGTNQKGADTPKTKSCKCCTVM